MGRDARLARALASDNRGNRGRLVAAHGYFLDRLLHDPRLEAHWQTWVAAQRTWQTDPRRAQLRALGMSEATIAANMQTVDIRQLTGVLAAMGVPWPWCADVLVRAYFPVLRHNAEHPDDPWVMKVSADCDGVPLGRLPPHLAAEIRRDVDWWYRHHVQDPRETIQQLTDEYVNRTNRVTEAHSVVSRGLIRAELLLQTSIDDLAGLED